MIEPEFNRHYASVVTSRAIEAEFEVVVNPESGTLADVAFSGATCLDRLAIHPGFRPQQPNTGGHLPHDGRPE